MTGSDEQVQRSHDTPRSPGVASHWAHFAAVMILGYLCMFRSFSYLGLPWWHIYIGELSLAAFLFCGPSTAKGGWLYLIRRIRRLDRLRAVLVSLLLYGGFEALRGLAHGYPLLTVLRDTGFNYYPIFFFLGIWAGLLDPDFLRSVAFGLAWFNGIYGVLCVLFLSRVPWTLPGTGDAASAVPFFSEPSGAAAIALLGLIVFEPSLRRVWHLVALNAFVLLGLQVRGEWLGFAVGVVVFASVTRRLKHLVTASAPVLLLLGLMYVAHVSIQSPWRRGDNVGNTGTNISTDYLVARALAPINKDLANELAPEEEVSFASGTAQWRLLWWAGIWSEVHSRLSNVILGLGYGYPIGDLNPYIEPDTFIQTPHSVFFYALGFTGWLGVAIYALLLWEIVRLLWRSYRITGQAFGLVCWAAFVTMAIFEPLFEAPYGAIPFFLLVGAATTPALLAAKSRRTVCQTLALASPETRPA